MKGWAHGESIPVASETGTFGLSDVRRVSLSQRAQILSAKDGSRFTPKTLNAGLRPLGFRIWGLGL